MFGWSKRAMTGAVLQIVGVGTAVQANFALQAMHRELKGVDPEIAWGSIDGWLTLVVRMRVAPALAGIITIVITATNRWRGKGERAVTISAVVIAVPPLVFVVLGRT